MLKSWHARQVSDLVIGDFDFVISLLARHGGREGTSVLKIEILVNQYRSGCQRSETLVGAHLQDKFRQCQD